MGTGSRRTRQKQNDDDESPGHATTRTRSVNATVPAQVPDLTFHDLRHLAGTLTALPGGTLKEIQARLGHASPDAAMIYQHVAHGRDDVLASEIDRIVSGQ